MTPTDIKALTDAMQFVFHFGFMDGVFYALGALKLCDILLLGIDRMMYRLRRYTTRAA